MSRHLIIQKLINFKPIETQTLPVFLLYLVLIRLRISNPNTRSIYMYLGIVLVSDFCVNSSLHLLSENGILKISPP